MPPLKVKLFNCIIYIVPCHIKHQQLKIIFQQNKSIIVFLLVNNKKKSLVFLFYLHDGMKRLSLHGYAFTFLYSLYIAHGGIHSNQRVRVGKYVESTRCKSDKISAEPGESK